MVKTINQKKILKLIELIKETILKIKLIIFIYVFLSQRQPESQVSISNPQKATPPPPTGGGGDTSKTQCQSKPNNNPPPPTSHGMVSSDPKDVWNKCLCGYAFMSKKELSVHILSNNNGKS